MHVKCLICENIIQVPDSKAGKVKCDKCSTIFNRTGQPLVESRQYMLKKLDELESVGFRYVRWCSANDEHVCPHCKDRNSRLYTIEKAREAIEGDFCCADKFWQGCRCLFVAERKPMDILKKKKSKFEWLKKYFKKII
jgi:hypothetical protein